MISRRSVLAAAALVAGAPTPVLAQAAVRLRVSTAAPPSDFLARALDQMKAEVEAGGTGLTMEVFPAGTLFKQGTEVPALQRGTLEMSTMTTFEVAQQVAELGLFNRGYLFRDYGHMRHVFDGPIGDAYRKTVSDRMGIEILAVGYLGTRQVNLRRARPVHGPQDLAGVKMRMPAGPEWLLLGRAIGVAPVPMGMAEVYLALKTGTIDAQENPLSILNAAKLFEVTEQVVLTAHMIQPVFINIAGPAWAKLSPTQQAALRQAAAAAAAANDSARLADEATITAALATRGLKVDTPDLAAFRASANKAYADSGAAKEWNVALLAQVEATQ